MGTRGHCRSSVTGQRLLEKGATGNGFSLPAVAIDGNCTTFAQARKSIQQETQSQFSEQLVVACPDPRIERWYLAVPESCQTVVGSRPQIGKEKCGRNCRKQILASAIREAGHPVMLDGIEFASELAEQRDLYSAGKKVPSLKAFVDDARDRLRVWC